MDFFTSFDQLLKTVILSTHVDQKKTDNDYKLSTLSTSIINESRSTEVTTHTENQPNEGKNCYREWFIVIIFC